MHLHGTIRSHLTVAIAAVAVLAGAPAAAQDSAVARMEVLQTEISKLQKEVAILNRDVAKGPQGAGRTVTQWAAIKSAPTADTPRLRASYRQRPPNRLSIRQTIIYPPHIQNHALRPQ